MTKNTSPLSARFNIYMSLVQSHLNFGILIYGAANQTSINLLQAQQNKAIRHVANAHYNSHTDPFNIGFKILKFKDLIDYNRKIFMFQYKHSLLPDSFENFFTYAKEVGQNRLRESEGNFILPTNNKKLNITFPHIELVKSWNHTSYID